LTKSLAGCFKQIILGLEWVYNYFVTKSGYGPTVSFLSSRSDDVQVFVNVCQIF